MRSRRWAHRKLVAGLPLDRLLTETDGPFVEAEGLPVRPTSVAGTVADLGLLRAIEAGQIARIIIANLRTLVTA